MSLKMQIRCAGHSDEGLSFITSLLLYVLTAPRRLQREIPNGVFCLVEHLVVPGGYWTVCEAHTGEPISRRFPMPVIWAKAEECSSCPAPASTTPAGLSNIGFDSPLAWSVFGLHPHQWFYFEECRLLMLPVLLHDTGYLIFSTPSSPVSSSISYLFTHALWYETSFYFVPCL